MTAYYVGTIRVIHALNWAQYVAKVGATISQYGGQVVFRGRRGLGSAAVPADEDQRIVTLRFESAEAARRWHDSAEYQRLVPLRDAGAEVELLLYEE